MDQLLHDLNIHTFKIWLPWLIRLLEFLILYIILHSIIRFILQKIENKTHNINLKEVQSNPATSFLFSIFNIILKCLLILFLLPILGVKTSSILAFVGAIGLGLGLGLQDMMIDLFSGVKLLMTKPFSVGDLIATSSTQGVVKSMNIFHTTITKQDNTEVFIPNRLLSSHEITNYVKHKNRCIEFEIPLDYHNSIEDIRAILLNVFESNSIIINHNETYKAHILLDSINANYLSFICSMWISSKEEVKKVKANIIEECHKKLLENNIKFPTKK